MRRLGYDWDERGWLGCDMEGCDWDEENGEWLDCTDEAEHFIQNGDTFWKWCPNCYAETVARGDDGKVISKKEYVEVHTVHEMMES